MALAVKPRKPDLDGSYPLRSASATRQPPLILTALSLAVAAFVLLPLVYLIIRASEAGDESSQRFCCGNGRSKF